MEKLVALGEPRPDEPAERRKMRELLAGQVELMRGLESRIQEGKREHARRIERMKTLWHQAEALRMSTPDRSAETAARLAALCDEIERGDVGAMTRAVPNVADAPTLER